MSTRKILSLICLCLTLLLIICLFIPFYDYSSELYYEVDSKYSLWKYFDNSQSIETAIIFLIELVFAIIIFILQLSGVIKDSKTAYLGLGFNFTFYLMTFIQAMIHDSFSLLAYGFWIGLIISTLTVILTIIGNFLSDEKKLKRIIYTIPIVGYDPATGKPIYAQITGYDPVTGKPIYK